MFSYNGLVDVLAHTFQAPSSIPAELSHIVSNILDCKTKKVTIYDYLHFSVTLWG